ncbi:MAG: galactose-1-phosphate uridylyltransferase [Calditrichaeota bacterium]|nr:MAG: galactose-1-phosphate uridylyltransferase [Calditrichota bacterium]
MPELRKDPIVGRWIIIAPERGQRPNELVPPVSKQDVEFSPFSPGNESMTPPEIFAIRPTNTPPNTPGWTLRVVPNKYPALRVEGELDSRAEGIYDVMNGIGAHEVIIETPDPRKDLPDLELSAIEDIFRTYKERILDLRRDIRLRHITVFKNYGCAAGATISHPHSQLLATPIVPKRIVEEMHGAHTYYGLKERCIYCDIIRQERKDNLRVAFEEDQFIALEPFASRFPFETWILPKKHASHYETLNREGIRHLAITMKTVLQKLNQALQTPPYNYVIHSAPLQEPAMAHYHWHIELMPKVTPVAGFEWGSGFYINPTSPEDAARFLKEIVTE